MAVLTTDGVLHVLPSDQRVGGGPCALTQRHSRVAGPLIHGTCILQRVAAGPTPLDLAADHRLVLPGGRSVTVRIVKHSLTACGPEIVRFEGPGQL